MSTSTNIDYNVVVFCNESNKNFMTPVSVLQTIIDYNMTPNQSRAYKLACIFDHLSWKLFPNIIHNTKSGKGDPRNKEVFKYAFKVINEHGHELEPKDDKLYVYAQLKVFKVFVDEGKVVLIGPNCLGGPKAWNRWKLFQNLYEKQKGVTQVNSSVNIHIDGKAIKELISTKEYLFKKFNRCEAKDILDALNSRTLLRWVIMKNVSGYYLYLSPIVTKWLLEKNESITSYFGNALAIYKTGITEDVKEWFQKEFSHEFRPGTT